MRILLLILLLLLAACSTSPVKTPEPRKQDGYSAMAEKMAKSGMLEQAANQYIAMSHNSEHSTSYRLRAAELYQQAGLGQQALSVIKQINYSELDAGQSLRADLVWASHYMQQQAATDALSFLLFDDKQISGEIAVKAYRLKGEALALLGDSLQAALSFQMAAIHQADDRKSQALYQKLFSSLDELTLKQLSAASIEYQNTPEFAGWLDFALELRQAIRKGEDVDTTLADWRERYPLHPANRDFLTRLLEEYRQRPAFPDKIALMLPLQGEYREAANAILEGFLASYYRSPWKPEVELISLDDKGQNVQQAYLDAIGNGAKWVIGPLLRDNILQLKKLEKPGAPILALNIVDETETGENFFQFGLKPEQDLEFMARQIRNLGHKRISLLLPAGARGQEMAQTFADTFQSLGGELMNTEFYQPASPDHSRSIKSILEVDMSQRRARRLESILRLPLDHEAERRDDIEAAFFFASSEQARLIRPQFQFHHASDLPLYATSHVYSGSQQKPETDLNGLRFCDAGWSHQLGEVEPSLAELENILPARQPSLNRFLAVGIDSMRLLPFMNWLQGSTERKINGASGRLWLNNTGIVQRDLQCLEYRKGAPVPLQTFSGINENVP